MINSKIIKMSQILSNKLKKSKKMKIKLKIKNMQFQKIKYQCLEDQYNKNIFYTVYLLTSMNRQV